MKRIAALSAVALSLLVLASTAEARPYRHPHRGYHHGHDHHQFKRFRDYRHRSLRGRPFRRGYDYRRGDRFGPAGLGLGIADGTRSSRV
jgi:hypothetical protein